MTYTLSYVNIIHLASFIFLYISIYTNPINLYDILHNPKTISIIPYIIFFVQVFFFLKNLSNNIYYLKGNKKILLLILLFLSQLLGVLNSYINERFIYDLIKTSAFYYLISISGIILVILNNCKNYQILFKINIIQIIILLLTFLIFLFLSEKISYGQVTIFIDTKLFDFKKEYIANSNGLGRISAILSLFFLIISIYKKKINYFVFIISTIFGGITLAYEGKFNSVILILLTIYILTNTKLKKKTLILFFYIFISTTFYYINYNYNKNNILNSMVKTKDKNEINFFNSNTNRVINIRTLNDLQIENLIKKKLEKKYHFIIENEFAKKLDNVVTGRLNKFIFFVLYNNNYLIGKGVMADRAVASSVNYITNNDSASAITYSYLTSGILGLIILSYFYFEVSKIFLIKKGRKIPLNIIFSKSLVLLIILRSLIENSFTVWGIDFIVLTLCVCIIDNYYKKTNLCNFSKN